LCAWTLWSSPLESVSTAILARSSLLIPHDDEDDNDDDDDDDDPSAAIFSAMDGDVSTTNTTIMVPYE
jgi:hypothetical protein